MAEQEDKATSGFDKDKNGNVFIAHDTSFERKKEKEKKKDTNESIIKKVKKAFGVKADHEKSLAKHFANKYRPVAPMDRPINKNINPNHFPKIKPAKIATGEPNPAAKTQTVVNNMNKTESKKKFLSRSSKNNLDYF